MKPKVIGYTALNYGSPYLSYAIMSIIDYIDEYHVLYSPDGSHGHKTELPTPETESRANLMRIARNAAGSKLHWHDGDWQYEGNQRDDIHVLSSDAAVVIVLDYDEIWSSSAIESVMEYAFTVTNSIPPFRCLRFPMWHYWRSFAQVIRHDPAFPIRVIFPRIETGEQTWHTGLIHHMGYAIPDYLMRYKLGIHGHKNEFRTDIDWLSERWGNPDAVSDLHPVGSDAWNIEKIDPGEYLPPFMRLHPFWGKDRIE